jgi:hypothetical protein
MNSDSLVGTVRDGAYLARHIAAAPRASEAQPRSVAMARP